MMYIVKLNLEVIFCSLQVSTDGLCSLAQGVFASRLKVSVFIVALVPVNFLPNCRHVVKQRLLYYGNKGREMEGGDSPSCCTYSSLTPLECWWLIKERNAVQNVGIWLQNC